MIPHAGAVALTRRQGVEYVDWPSLGVAAHLSSREVLVLRGILAGRTLQQVADDADLGLGTVKTYVRRAYQKLGVHDRLQMALAIAGFRPVARPLVGAMQSR